MIITLKNNDKIKLSWDYLCIEYAEEYPGGLPQLQKDFKAKIHPVKSVNRLISSVIRANYGKLLTHEEALKLVNFNDYEKILTFIEKESNLLEDYKKKETTFRPKRKTKKRK